MLLWFTYSYFTNILCITIHISMSFMIILKYEYDLEI